jgi:hypothetical protein
MRLVAALIAAPALLLLTGCGATPVAGDSCFPGRLSIADDSLTPGSVLHVMGEGADCRIEFTDEQEYRLVVIRPWEPDEYYVDMTVPVADDGSFTVTLELPPDMPSGEAYVRVTDGYRFECDDTGSCVDVGATFSVLS